MSYPLLSQADKDDLKAEFSVLRRQMHLLSTRALAVSVARAWVGSDPDFKEREHIAQATAFVANELVVR